MQLIQLCITEVYQRMDQKKHDNDADIDIPNTELKDQISSCFSLCYGKLSGIELQLEKFLHMLYAPTTSSNFQSIHRIENLAHVLQLFPGKLLIIRQ